MNSRSHRLYFALCLASLLSYANVVPGLCQLDNFELAPGVEQTQIPKRLRPGTPIRKGVSPEDVRRIETLRADIERLYQNKSYEEAEPFYKDYVAMLEKIGVDDNRLASALQNYAQLLRKLHKDAAANEAEVKATAILTRAGQRSNAYSLKQYRLGMSLDEFTQLGPPNGDAKKVKAVCSCDAGQTVESINDEDKTAKVVQCGFWKVSPNGTITVPYSMTVASIECEPDFRFVENDGVYRLYEISIVFYNSNFDKIKAALIDKYGDPSGNELTKMRTDMGNIYPLTNLIWDNGISKIRLTNADGTNTGRTKLRYIHRQLFLAYAQRINDARGSAGKKAVTDL